MRQTSVYKWTGQKEAALREALEVGLGHFPEVYFEDGTLHGVHYKLRVMSRTLHGGTSRIGFFHGYCVASGSKWWTRDLTDYLNLMSSSEDQQHSAH